MAERGVWVSPTISRGWRRFLDNPDSTTLKRMQAAFKDMRARNIPFIASTDAGIPGVYHHHLPQALPVSSPPSPAWNRKRYYAQQPAVPPTGWS